MQKSVKESYDRGFDLDLYKKMAYYLCSEDEGMQRIGINMYYNAPLINRYHENYFDFSPREGIDIQRRVTIARINVDVRRRKIFSGLIHPKYDDNGFIKVKEYKVI